MTLWILHQSVTAEDEVNITGQQFVNLPFGNLPDLSEISTPQQARELLSALNPDDPPETIVRKLDRFWPVYTGLHFDDLIVLPLYGAEEAVFAKVTGGYQYAVGENGQDIHRVPVEFHDKRVPLNKFKKYAELFVRSEPKMIEVTNAAARIMIREQLPYSYNRFAKFKWLLVIFFLMNLVRMLSRFGGNP